MTICNEKLLGDIAEIFIYSVSDLSANLPPTVAGLSALTLSSLGKPMAVISIREDADVDMIMDTLPTVKVTSARVGKSLIYTHDITSIVNYGCEKVQALVEKSKNQDVCLIYRTIENKYLLTYTYPETSVLTHEDTSGSDRTVHLKVQIKSLSGLIDVTLPSNK